VFIIFGWMRRFTVLGVKLDECQTCGQVCEHVVGRKTNWFTLFWMPVLFLGFSHGMLCSTCATWTGLSFGAVRDAMRTGRLSLDRQRPASTAALEAEGASLVEARAAFDRLLVNPKRGFFDGYLKAWPVLVAALMVVGMVSPSSHASISSSSPSSSVSTSGQNTLYTSTQEAAHTCWEDTSGDITGCRLADGSVMGESTLSTITCYFDEPLPATATSLRCSSR
jgi:hypothetical protein